MKSTPDNLEVLYEDNHIIAVNKQPSDIVQGDKTKDEPLSEIVKQYIKIKYNKPGNVYLGVIHRIDRPVSGVILFAKTSKALTRLNKMFKDKNMQKTYWAVVEKGDIPNKGTIINYLRKTEKNNKSTAYKKEVPGSKLSELSYTVKGKGDNYLFLEVLPKTGRHHQIRVQLSSIGTTIKGDVKYGARRSNKDLSVHLHARKIEFEHPVTKEQMLIKANPNTNDALWKEFTTICK